MGDVNPMPITTEVARNVWQSTNAHSPMPDTYMHKPSSLQSNLFSSSCFQLRTNSEIRTTTTTTRVCKQSTKQTSDGVAKNSSSWKQDPLPTPAIASSTFQFLEDHSFLSSTKMPAACNNLQDALSNYLYPSVALKLNWNYFQSYTGGSTSILITCSNPPTTILDIS